jgi:hypothetical protein
MKGGFKTDNVCIKILQVKVNALVCLQFISIRT